MLYGHPHFQAGHTDNMCNMCNICQVQGCGDHCCAVWAVLVVLPTDMVAYCRCGQLESLHSVRCLALAGRRFGPESQPKPACRGCHSRGQARQGAGPSGHCHREAWHPGSGAVHCCGQPVGQSAKPEDCWLQEHEASLPRTASGDCWLEGCASSWGPAPSPAQVNPHSSLQPCPYHCNLAQHTDQFERLSSQSLPSYVNMSCTYVRHLKIAMCPNPTFSGTILTEMCPV